MRNAPRENSAILLNFIKVFVLSSFEWPFYTGFTVLWTAKYKILHFPGVCLVSVTVKFRFFLVTLVATSNAKDNFFTARLSI